MSPLHAQYIVVSSSHRPRHLDGGSSASPGKEKRGPSGPRPRPPPISPRDVNRPARLAVDGLGVSEPDPDGGPSAGTRQRVGLGPRGGDESLELGRSGRRGPHLERAAVAARLVLDDDRRVRAPPRGSSAISEASADPRPPRPVRPPPSPRRSGSPSRATGRPTTARSGSRTWCTCAMSATGSTMVEPKSDRLTARLLHGRGAITMSIMAALADL